MNFCAGLQVTNGMQITSGSCNGIPMGKIPSTNNMISAIITNPQPGDQLPANTPFNVSVQTQNLRAGFFVNPTTNYYTAPQDLDDNGNIIGHCHVSVQDIGDLRDRHVDRLVVLRRYHGADPVCPDGEAFIDDRLQ